MEVCEMQNADTILSILEKQTINNKDFEYKRLYRNLFNADLFVSAYGNIQSKPGNMTPGVDNKTIDGFKMQWIEDTINLLKEEKYYPLPARRVYIPKKNGGKRPLGIPTFMDKLVQEVLRMILEKIYEPTFDANSHGFRPKRSCHTALYQIKKSCKGTNWIIEGDITGCFDNIDHEILMKILSKRIKDGRFLELIRRFLKAGYFEFQKKRNSISGTPQGGILSPLLANIYLNELDIYMNKVCTQYNKGARRKQSLEYHRMVCNRHNYLKRGKKKEAKRLHRKILQTNPADSFDTNYIRVKYVRYADDFLVCIIGSKKLAEEIKLRITEYLKNNLKLELNQQKTFITNLKNEKVKFLGYEITKSQENSLQTRDVTGRKKRHINGSIQLLVPWQVITDKLKPFKKGKKAIGFPARRNLPVLDIIQTYNAEIRGLYQYYCLATNVSRELARFQYYHYYSLAKTIAGKENISVKKVHDKYGVEIERKDRTGTRKIIGYTYPTYKGKRTITYYNGGLKKVDRPISDMSDTFGNHFKSGQLLQKLASDCCELCGTKTERLEVHHIKKLKDIKRKYSKHGKRVPDWVLLMSVINRKTLVVCEECHKKIHNGTLKKKFPK